jgi:hypothetical protein
LTLGKFNVLPSLGRLPFSDVFVDVKGAVVDVDVELVAFPPDHELLLIGAAMVVGG